MENLTNHCLPFLGSNIHFREAAMRNGICDSCKVLMDKAVDYRPDLANYCSAICKARGLVSNVDNKGCWAYARASFSYKGTTYSIRQIFYELFYGKPLKARDIYLKCPSRLCANPLHMAAIVKRKPAYTIESREL